jgi:hypothetical protein
MQNEGYVDFVGEKTLLLGGAEYKINLSPFFADRFPGFL